MSNDVLITPASRKIEFKDSSASIDAKIETDSSGNLIITNPGGDISLGDTNADIFIGDGVNNIDIVFEQNGEIRGTSGVTLTLGASNSNVVMATTLNLNSNDLTNVGSLTVNNLTVNGTTTTVSSVNTTITDSLIELNSGLTGANSKDIGFIFERGSTGHNAAFFWDESSDRFRFITTTNTGSATTIGDNITEGTIQAGSFFGNGANLTSLNGTNISSGTVAEARIASLAASKITSGTFADARIPSLAASKTTSGTFADARIPSLAASKITSGELSSARLPAYSAPVRAGELSNSQDLNDLIAANAGFYYQTSNADTTGNNYPNAHAGSLIVQKSAGNATQLYQTYSATDTRLYFRSNYNAGYGTWQRAFADNYHPNADKLTSAVNINGVAFDGSGSITVADSTKLPLAGGTMTGNINMDGNELNNVELIKFKNKELTDFSGSMQMILDANDADSNVPGHGDHASDYPMGIYFTGDADQSTTTLGNGLVKVWHTGHFNKAHIDYFVGLYNSGVTTTEYDYLDGVTSNIQTQLDNKLSSFDITTQTDSKYLRSDVSDTMTGALYIEADNQAGGALRIEANQTNPDNDMYFAQEIYSTLSGSTATTGDREQGGIYMDINSTATGGDTSNEHRAYGMYVDLDSTGDADLVYGVYADATATPTTGTTSNVFGGYFRAEDNGGAGSTTTLYGVQAVAYSDNATSDVNSMYAGYFKTFNAADSASIPTARGVYGEVEITTGSGDIYGNTYVFESQYDNNTSAAPTHTAALYYGNYAGTLPTTALGVYIVDPVPNSFAGSVRTGLGTTSLSAYGFIGDLNTGMYSPANHELGFTTNGTQRLKLTTSELVINDASNDYNFRVESNNNDAMIFVDGGTDKVSIGTSDTGSMDGRFTVQGANIGNTDGDTQLHATIAGSRHHLDFEEERTASTSDWQNTTYRLGMRVDTTDHQAIEFVSDGSSAEHIDIKTGNRVFNTRFTHDGKVGIGTSTPGNKLSVARSQSDTFSNTHLGLKATSTTNTTGRTGISMATSTVNNFGVTLNAMRKGTDGVPTFGINMHNNSAGGLEAFTVKADGNVGIGISDPKTELHILGASGNAQATTVTIGGDGTNGNHTSKLEFSEASNGSGGILNYGFSLLADGNSSNNFLIRNHNNSTSGNIAICIDRATGFVGIGTGSGSASSKLTVKQNMTNGATTAFTAPHLKLQANNTTDTTGFVGMTFDTSTTANYGWSYGALRDDGGNGDMVWRFHSASAQGNERFRIMSTGNVGIGDGSPDFKLAIRTPAIPSGSTYAWPLDLSRPGTDSRGLTFGVGSAGGTHVMAAHNGDVGIGQTFGSDSNGLPQFYETLSITHDGTASIGRVGIGDTDPIAKLEVAGDKYVLTNSGQARGGIHLRPTSTPGLNEYGGAISFSCNGSGSSAIAAVNDGGADSDGNGLAFITHPSGTGSADAVEQMRLNEIGNLGLGDPSAPYKLTVNAGLSDWPGFFKSTDNKAGIIIADDDTTTYFGAENSRAFMGMQSGVSVNNLNINATGQVGLGTGSPGYKLHVVESTENAGAINIEDGTSWLRLVPNLGGGGFNPMSVAGDIGLIFSNDNDGSTDSTSNGLLIASHSTSGYGIKIVENGKVGIKTGAPTYTLDVNGDMGVNEYIYHNDDDNTYLRFLADRVVIAAGGRWVIDCDEGTDPDILKLMNDAQRAYSDGTFHAKGDIIAYSTTTTSDRRLKKNIQPLENSLEKVQKLQGVSFDWKDEDKGSSIGFIAQDFEKELPDLIKEVRSFEDKDDTIKTINYGNTVALLVEAMKEQQEQIKELQKQVQDLTNQK